ncbi:sulfur carrier protein ThiS [Thermospira aquatica]|uniref:Sulfur carrier protein ThiS n=1 Tax=Thermospira aquatica TaxID=2828656 RepID=A0AAX3BFG8_9SPIR|nr:sulfur carrier protein ThiS [Thermospira aquatica]URA11030.1 sulfur carrier protein ThiS [Thermospira aquatica]
MRIKVNGEEREILSPLSLQEYLDSLGLSERRVVVEYNGEILSKEAWPNTTLKDGDRLEIVHFVGGG